MKLSENLRKIKNPYFMGHKLCKPNVPWFEHFENIL